MYITGTRGHSVLHKHFTLKRAFALDHTQFVNRSKIGSKEMLKKYDQGAPKHDYEIETGYEEWIYSY